MNAVLCRMRQVSLTYFLLRRSRRTLTSARYCETEIALKAHLKSKVHKRRLKELKQPAYTLREAEQSAGLGVDNRQRGVEDVVKKMEGMTGVEETKSS